MQTLRLVTSPSMRNRVSPSAKAAMVHAIRSRSHSRAISRARSGLASPARMNNSSRWGIRLSHLNSQSRVAAFDARHRLLGGLSRVGIDPRRYPDFVLRLVHRLPRLVSGLLARLHVRDRLHERLKRPVLFLGFAVLPIEAVWSLDDTRAVVIGWRFGNNLGHVVLLSCRAEIV